jgi:hypothetical protein
MAAAAAAAAASAAAAAAAASSEGVYAGSCCSTADMRGVPNCPAACVPEAPLRTSSSAGAPPAANTRYSSILELSRMLQDCRFVRRFMQLYRL